MYCPDFTPRLCDRLKKPPYVCNDCPPVLFFHFSNYIM
jgi:hypothetical protein